MHFSDILLKGVCTILLAPLPEKLWAFLWLISAHTRTHKPHKMQFSFFLSLICVPVTPYSLANFLIFSASRHQANKSSKTIFLAFLTLSVSVLTFKPSVTL